MSCYSTVVFVFINKSTSVTSTVTRSHTTTTTTSITSTRSNLLSSTFFTSTTQLLATSHTDTTRIQYTSSTTTTTTCRPFTVPDHRPFYEREHSQSNLPRRISKSSYRNLLRQLHTLRLIVVSCARNVQLNIDNYRSHIEPIVDLFHSSSRILICESDSTDKTVEKLYQWSRAQVYTYGNMSRSYPDRTDRLAYCRNILINKTHDLKADYILITDLDIFSANVSSFLSNFQYNTDDWSVMTASSSGAYYDIWALRTLSNSVLNYDVWHRIWNLEKSGKNYCSRTLSDLIIRIHQKHIPIKHGLIEVRSAFGGAALYRANSTHGCQYNGAKSACEHVLFHLCIRDMNQGRIFINPKFQIS